MMQVTEPVDHWVRDVHQTFPALVKKGKGSHAPAGA